MLMKYLISLILCCVSLGAWAQSEPASVIVNGVQWDRCAGEHNQCSFTDTESILYGAWPPVSPSPMYKTFGPFTGGHFCDNALGSDPAYGYLKSCYLKHQGNPTNVVVNGVTWTKCADEHSTTNGTCNFSGSTKQVLYGS